MSRALVLTKHLRAYDRELYASCEKHPLRDDKVMYVLRRNRVRPHEPHFIFALTQDWSPKGRPVEWGIEVVMNRIKAMDLWKDETIVDRVIRDGEKIEESEKREARNTIESFLKDFRREFAKGTNHINTSLLNKYDKRRERDYGYSK